MSDNSPESSSLHSKRTVDELNLNSSETQKTVVRPNTSKAHQTAMRKDSLEGKTIGEKDRYLLQSLLGKGGMSKVYQALDTKFKNKLVAIKLMTVYSSTNTKHLIKRFMAEIEAISSLKHPNIIQIFDYGVTPDELPFSSSPFYVMEYFSGETLKSRLAANKILSQDSLFHIIGQVCAGLKEAHDKGIVHRDLKPDNIFLVAGGAFGEIVKIIDFGIAKNISSDNPNYTKTQTGSFIGTYRYASPEQCRGLSNLDQRTDIYSLGNIIYEAISGTNPYDLDNDSSTTIGDWIACHIRVPPKPLKEQPGCENIDSKLENLVMKCLAKSPSNRFLNIDELQNALANSFSLQNYDTEKYPKTSNYQRNKSYRVKRNDEGKLEPTQKVVGTDEQPTIPAPTVAKTDEQPTISSTSFIPSSKGIKYSKRLGLITGVATILMGLFGIGGYLLFINQPEKISQNKIKNPAIDSESNININDRESLDTNNIAPLLESLETQYKQGNYEDCYQLAISYLDRNNSEINKWIGNCGLEAAKIKANTNSYIDALTIVQTIPNTVPNYQEVKDNINTWSEEALDYATKVYKQEGKLEEAIKIINIIQENPNFKTTSADLISQWQQEEEKYQAIIERAQSLLSQEQWDAAKKEVEKIPSDFAFLRRKAQPILNEANQQINEIAIAERREQSLREEEERRLEAAVAAAEQLRLEQEQRLKAEAKAAAEQQRLEQEQRLKAEAEAAAEKQRLEQEQRRKAEAEAEEQLRLEEAAAAEEQRRLEEAAAAEEQRRLEEEAAAEEQRRLEEAAAAEEQRRLAAAVAEEQLSIFSVNGEEVPTHIQSIMRGIAARQELELSNCQVAPVRVMVNQLYGFCAHSNYRYNAGKYHMNVPNLE